MKQLIISLLVGLMICFTACDKTDNGQESDKMPITNLGMPDPTTPIIWGESVIIRGIGFIAQSEIWLGDTDNQPSIKSEVTEVSDSKLIFTAPDEVVGQKEIILKQHGKNWTLGTLIFDAPSLMPIKNLKMPDPNIPIQGGTTVIILGEGFVSSSEIWMQELDDTNLEKTAVVQVSGSQISFTVPEQANGKKNIILKQDDKEWLLGKLTFQSMEMKPPKYYIAKMGTLGTTVLNQTQKDTITVMQLYGEINADDFYVLSHEMRRLAILDLSEVTCKDNAIPSGAFMNCICYLRKITLPKNLKRIEEFAFAGRILTLNGSLVIPDGVTYIGEMAFCECVNLTGDLIIPSSVTYIGRLAFAKCSGFNGILSLPAELTTLGEYAFAECSKFTGSLTLPNGLTSIGQETFSGCKGFTGSLILPNEVTYIGKGAFNECGFTGTLTLPSSLQTIEKHAFFRCAGLEGNLTIPNSVTTIGEYAFSMCTGFKGHLTLSDQLIEIMPFTFACTGANRGGFTGSLTIPNGVTIIDECAFQFSGFDGVLTLGDGLLSIENSAFYTCGFTGSLTIPDGVETICESAFYECKKFDGTLTLSKELISIEQNAFRSCGFTGSLTLPDKLKEIGMFAFLYCGNLNGTLTIPIGVTEIQREAFYDCNALEKIHVSWPTPIVVQGGTFPKEALFEVPNESLSLYRAKWGNLNYKWRFTSY